MRPLALALLLAASACVTTVETSPPGIDDLLVTKALPVRAWFVVDEDRPRGSVVRYETFESPPRIVYFVRNVHHQDLGVIDHLGRAYRYHPHEEEAEWLGSGSVLEGAQRILGLTQARLLEVPVEHLVPEDPPPAD